MCFGNPFSKLRIFRNKVRDKDSAAADGIESVIMSTEIIGTDSPDPTKTAEEPPAYDNQQEKFLDPTLAFQAESFKIMVPSQKKRDKAFAKAIVNFIATQVKMQNTTAPHRDWGYCYNEKNTLTWDELIGYPAVEAFKHERVSFILDQAKLDLEKRGFAVKKLELFLGDCKIMSYKDVRVCTKTALECTCWHHGMFVGWNLGIGK